MPFINGRFYANPIFGRALGRARLAEAGKVWSEEYPARGQQHTQEIRHEDHTEQRLVKYHEAAHKKHSGDVYDAATTPEGVANQIYNETAGLRPTVNNGIGPGTDWDMQAARIAMAHVIQNRAKAKILNGLASPTITDHEAKATSSVGSKAYDAHGESVHAAHVASMQQDPLGGATNFYLDYGQGPPGYAKAKKLKPVGVFGPFDNPTGGGDAPKGKKVKIIVLP